MNAFAAGTVPVGISGFATYLPPYRVDLQKWCEWRGDNWDKIKAVVGHGFRMCGPTENVYTMAASAVMRLIRQYDIDPSRVGYLALGTESSTDNSAGAVIVKGMVNQGLEAEGRLPLSRYCEVPEFKHACLGGVYGVKNALRYLATDGQEQYAIVVCSDIAEYESATSGEPTQGAGAVAMLLEADPKMLEVDLMRTGSSSDYRGPDFRKPFSRYVGQTLDKGRRLKDFPLFNGKYSTTCYVDEVILAIEDLLKKIGEAGRSYFDRMRSVFLHRPYHRMPETGFAMAYLYGLAHGDDDDIAMLQSYCQRAGVESADVVAELRSKPDVHELFLEERSDEDVYPKAMAALKAFRNSNDFSQRVTAKLALGADEMMEVGNLYTAALPAWLAAGMAVASEDQEADLAGEQILAIGYGSGDAAEAIPMRVCPQWREAASRIHFRDIFAQAVDLDQASYETLHDGAPLDTVAAGSDFVVDRVGAGEIEGADDSGIEYYAYVPQASQTVTSAA